MICVFHKFKSIGFFFKEYQPIYYNHGLEILEIRICTKCGKEKIIQHDNFCNLYASSHREIRKYMESKGLKDFYEYKQKEITKTWGLNK